MTWRNWGRSFAADPIGTAVPADLEQLQRLIVAQRGTGIGVRPVGASHSFSAVAQPEGMHVRLDSFAGLVRADVDRRRVTFGAGTRLFEIPRLLEPFGLALPNMGDIDRQTLAGAVSTGTHGAGRSHPSIGANITVAKLVDGRGEIIEISAETNPELLPAVQLALGALGVLTEIELQCVPAFTLEADERVEPLDAVVAEWSERNADDHFEFYWFSHTDVVTTKTNRRTSEPTEPMSAARRWAEETLLGGGLHGLASELGARIPALTPAVNRMASRAMARPRFVDRSDRVFVTRRHVRFRELEFAVPFDALPAALADVRRLFDREHHVTFPLEVRAAAADDAMLSTAFERDVAYIAVHAYAGQDPRRLFAEAQRVLLAHDGRPHWGKMHSVGHEHFARVLPRFAEFLAARDRLDPDRVFANEYTRRVLGE